MDSIINERKDGEPEFSGIILRLTVFYGTLSWLVIFVLAYLVKSVAV